MAEQTRYVIIVLAALALTGCASSGALRAGDVARTPAAAATPGEAGAGGGTAELSSQRRQPGAVALQAQAGEEQAAGDLPGAAATLERALRIDAADPELWLALAEVRLAQGEATQATELARRAASLSTQDSSIHARARELERRAALTMGARR